MRPSISGRYSLSPELDEEQVSVAAGIVSPPAAEAPRVASEPRIPEVRLPDPRPTFDSASGDPSCARPVGDLRRP